MSIANPHSPVIAQMRDDRARRPDHDVDVGHSGGVPPAPQPITLDPHLQQLKGSSRFAELLQIDDPTELAAVVEAIQTLVDRCRYHQEGMLFRRRMKDWRAARRGRKQRARRRGRPTGAANFAARQFGLGLAMIWWEHAGRLPSRYEPARSRVAGSYVEFVVMVVGTLPPPARRGSSASSPGIEYLVRTSITDFRAARNAPDEYRRRGLIEQDAWLHGSDAA